MSEQRQDPAQSELPWWVRATRSLRQAMIYIWSTLMVGIAVGVIANTSTATTDTPLSKLYIVSLARTYPVPVFSALGILVLVTLLATIASFIPSPASPQPLSDQDRARMLRRLRFRYEQMLAQSLQGAVQIELGLASRSAAVQQTASLALRLPSQPDQPLPPQTSIMEAYERAQQELLILGEPGAGKSTLLLELAHHLVEQAEQDITQPLPAILPLSSWATKRPPLQDWLIEQVASLYDVPKSLSAQWIQTQHVLPLLDGLDEMKEGTRPTCIEAINTYHREHLGSLVVCSRTNEYDRATKEERLALHTAVVVEPLSSAQVDTHLAMLGKPLSGLRSALKKNTLLQTIATTPLLLQVLMLTYHGTKVRELSQKEAQLREQIWTDYTQRMVERKGDLKRYPLDITVTRLKWLASQMRSRNQTILFLEQLQPDWLDTQQRILYRLSVVLASVLFFGLVSGLLFGLFFGLVSGLFFGLLFGLPIGLTSQKIEPVETLVWSQQGLRAGLYAGLYVGLPIGLLFGLFFGLVSGLFFGLLLGLTTVALFNPSIIGENNGISIKII